MITQRSLFSRAFLFIFASLLIVVVVLSGVFVFAIQQSIERWNVHRGRRLQNLMVPELSRAYQQFGELTEDRIHEALSPFLTSSVYVYVTTPDKEGLYLFVRGERNLLPQTLTTDEDLAEIRAELSTPVPVLSGERVIAYLYADTLGFRESLANQYLVQSMLTTVTSGTLASLGVAFVLALLFSRLLSGHAEALATGIGALAAGRRDVEFPIRGPRELRTIATSATTLQDQLSREERLRRRWTQDIAHDLRTPITALKTQFEGIKEGVLAASDERLAALFEEITRIERLVNDLRELSRMESPEMSLEREYVDGAALLEELEASFRPRVGPRVHRFTVDTAGTTEFEADEHLVRRALTNLLDNAFRYAREGGEVVLRMIGREDAAWFEISNTGYVAVEEVELMFERFYRGEGARRTPGSGLGLSIADTIVRLHGGEIRFRQHGDTTSVWVSIPSEGSDD